MPGFTHAVIGCGRVAPDHVDSFSAPPDTDRAEPGRHARLLRQTGELLAVVFRHRYAPAGRDVVATRLTVETPGHRPAPGKEFAP